jgi:hypothetical protein
MDSAQPRVAFRGVEKNNGRRQRSIGRILTKMERGDLGIVRTQ